ncbi:hypothetical protein [Sulfuricurvum sp.]|uniref:hypothetical protein n=1 Tax=Sulfuricurvum sp. TaxID=2025608 RepID=UPI003BB51C3E
MLNVPKEALGYMKHGMFTPIAEEHIRSCKQYYGFFHTEYDGGIISEDGGSIDLISFETINDEIRAKSISLNISTFEKRSDLVRESETIYRQFVDMENLMSQTVFERFTIEDLLYKERSHSVSRYDY